MYYFYGLRETGRENKLIKNKGGVIYISILNNTNKIFKQVKDKLPSIRQLNKETIGVRLTPYNTPATSQQKLNLYYDTLQNLYVQRCCEVYKDTALTCGFSIDQDTLENDNPYTRNYIKSIINSPEGISGDLTWAGLNSLIWDSFLVLGDAFFEISTDNNFNIFNGLRYIPNNEIYYDTETSCYGLISNPRVKYEPSDLIHIYQRNPRPEYSKFGVSVIDSVGGYLALLINALTYNNSVLNNKGLEPSTFISFDKDISDANFISEVERLAAQFKEREDDEIMFIRGATFEKGNNTNNEMSYLELMKFTRDAIISRFGVPPQKAGIIETANLGSGSGDSQNKDWKQTFDGKSVYITDPINKCLKDNGFTERFSFNNIDVTDDLYQAQVDQIYLNMGVKTIDEVRNSLGLDKLPVNSWGGYYGR